MLPIIIMNIYLDKISKQHFYAFLQKHILAFNYKKLFSAVKSLLKVQNKIIKFTSGKIKMGL